MTGVVIKECVTFMFSAFILKKRSPFTFRFYSFLPEIITMRMYYLYDHDTTIFKISSHPVFHFVTLYDQNSDKYIDTDFKTCSHPASQIIVRTVGLDAFFES